MKKLISVLLVLACLPFAFYGCSSNTVEITQNEFFKDFSFGNDISFEIVEISNKDSVTPYLSTAEYKSNKTDYTMLDVVADVKNNSQNDILLSDFITATAKDKDGEKYYSDCSIENESYTEISDTLPIAKQGSAVLHILFQIPKKDNNYTVDIKGKNSKEKFTLSYTYNKKQTSTNTEKIFKRYINIGDFSSAYKLANSKSAKFSSDDVNYCKAGIYYSNGAYGDAINTLKKCNKKYKLANSLKSKIKNDFENYNDVYKYQNCSRCYSYIRVDNGMVSMVATQTGTEKTNFKYQIVKFKGDYYIASLNTSISGISKSKLIYKVIKDNKVYRVVGASKKADIIYCGSYKSA